MTKKRIIITGMIAAVIFVGAVICIKMTSEEKGVEAMTEMQTAEEPEIEAEPEEIETASEEIETEPEEIEADSLHTDTLAEAETEEEELQAVIDEEETEDTGVDSMDATMWATTNVNLRAGTAVTTESLRLVNFAEEVSVTGITVDKQWYRVQDGEQTGFIASSYLSETKPSQNTSTQQASASTESGGGSTQSSGNTSAGGGNGVSQAEKDQLNAVLAQLNPNQGAYSDTGEMAWGGSGGHRLND